MKIMIVSDTHGRQERYRRALTLEEKAGIPDKIIHCGDVEGDEEWIRRSTQCMSVPMVRGNCDFFSKLPSELELDIAGLKVLVAHGHQYGVSMGTERIEEEARDRGCQIVMFGHTHRPVIQENDGLWIINPGSLSYPRQDGHKYTYIIMTVDEGVEPEFELKTVD